MAFGLCLTEIMGKKIYDSNHIICTLVMHFDGKIVALFVTSGRCEENLAQGGIDLTPGAMGWTYEAPILISNNFKSIMDK